MPKENSTEENGPREKDQAPRLESPDDSSDNRADSPLLRVIDTMTLRFEGETQDGDSIHELQATHVANVLEGLVGLTEDFEKAGAFHSSDGPLDTRIFVRPPRQGSFAMDVVMAVVENWEQAAAVGAAAGTPKLASIVWWATRSMRADVEDFDYLDNGNVKVKWQDGVSSEMPESVWQELNKRPRRRRKQLRKIMTPLADLRVDALEVSGPDPESKESVPASFALHEEDYDAAHPVDEEETTTKIFETKALMAAIDFDNPTRWKIRTDNQTRTAVVDDPDFLKKVADGLAIGRDDVFRVKVREDKLKKNGRTTTTWTVLNVRTPRSQEEDRGDVDS